MGETESVTIRAAAVVLVTVAIMLAVLFARFGSGTPELTTTESLTAVPAVVPDGTFTAKVKMAVDPRLKSGSVQVMVPLVVPEGRVLQDQPVGGLSETMDVPVGMASVKVAPVASLGPLLVTVCV